MDHEIGCIGLGLLGSALAHRLRQAGWPVVGYDLLVERREEFTGAGGQAVDSLEQVARKCRQFVLCLPDSHVVAEVVERLRHHLSPGDLLIDTTTGDPMTTAAMGAALAGQSIHYLDATVAGSSQQARQGQILLLVGGSPDVVQQARPLLESLTEGIFHLGPCGCGARMKLVFNLVLGLNRAVLAEGLSLGSACGLDPRVVLDVLQSGAAHSAVMDSKGQKMLSRDFRPQARLAQHLKDVRLIQQMAEQVEQRLPLTEVHRRLLERAVELGFGPGDNCAIITAYDNPAAS
jgi:3-hydroxyisobutyrate dehydrogenase-like beta-hydroxyacid dehydrogenase